MFNYILVEMSDFSWKWTAEPICEGTLIISLVYYFVSWFGDINKNKDK